MLSRRLVLSAALAAPAARPKTFVLVHGAWHGGFCWREVERLLRAQGHTVFAPTLTGLAERAHLFTPDLGLQTHVTDVTALLETEELTQVTLVGHSYGGLVITAAGAAQRPRIAELVYLDAFIPEPGQSGYDLMPRYAAKWRERVKTKGAGLRIPPMLDAKSMGVDDPERRAWLDRKLTPHPARTFEDPNDFDLAAWKSLPRRYLHCARYPGFGPTAARAKTLGFTVQTLDCGHDAMVAAPTMLAEALLTA